MDDEALAYVVGLLSLEATRCFAEASDLKVRATTASKPDELAARATLCALAGRYSDAAAAWLVRLGPDALLGQAALLRAPRSAAQPLRRGVPVAWRPRTARRRRSPTTGRF